MYHLQRAIRHKKTPSISFLPDAMDRAEHSSNHIISTRQLMGFLYYPHAVKVQQPHKLPLKVIPKMSHQLNRWSTRTNRYGSCFYTKLPVDDWYLRVQEYEEHSKIELRLSLDAQASVPLIRSFTPSKGTQARVELVNMVASYLSVMADFLRREQVNLRSDLEVENVS